MLLPLLLAAALRWGTGDPACPPNGRQDCLPSTSRDLSARAIDAANEWKLGEAEETAERAFAAALACDDLAGQALAADALGVVARLRGDRDRALDETSLALALAEEAGDAVATTRAHNDLGRIYADLTGDLDLAHASYTRALELSPPGTLRSRILNNLGDLERRRSRRTAALRFFRGALDAAVEAKDRYGRLAAIPAEVIAMRGERLQLRGAAKSADLAVLEPVGTAVVSDRPTFRWSAPGPVRVEIFDERFHPITHSEALAAHEWSPPEPLPRGRTYLWQVVSADGQERRLAPVPPLPDARFRIVSAEEARRIEAARGPSLERASLYAGAGALDDASRELQRLKESEAVRRLRNRVDNLR
jgi:tetratricopeptide (TPR) repeat protein